MDNIAKWLLNALIVGTVIVCWLWIGLVFTVIGRVLWLAL